MTESNAGALCLTGVPGWLTAALLADLSRRPLASVSELRALTHPAAVDDAARLVSRHPQVRRLVPFDLTDGPACCQIRRDLHEALAGSAAILHAAGVIHARHPRDWHAVNTEGTLRLAEAARDRGVRRFVFISSNAAAGPSPDGERLLTEADPARPIGPYGCSKWAAERGLRALEVPGQFDVVILRPCMFYGPPVPLRHVAVYRRVRAGRLPLVGSGEYRRSVTYIGHLVDAVRLALTHPRAAGGTYFVADPQPTTTRAVCEAMADALEVPWRPLRLPALAGPAAHAADRLLTTCGLYWQSLHLLGESHWHVGVSVRKITEELGWQPRVTLPEGMREAVAWCRREGLL